MDGCCNMDRARSGKIWRELGYAEFSDQKNQRWFREYKNIMPAEKEERAGPEVHLLQF